MDPLFIAFLISLTLLAVSSLGMIASVDVSVAVIILAVLFVASATSTAFTGICLILQGAEIL